MFNIRARTPLGPIPTAPRRATGGLIAAAVLSCSGLAVAGPIEPIDDWRTANDTVGRFERGHIDLLRWEAEHLPPGTTPQATATVPWTLNDAIVAAQRTRPDLVARPGLNALERAQLQLRQRELALQVERAWLQAVVARHGTAIQRQMLETAQAGHELALRMTRIGNWPEARGHRETLTLLDARAQFHLAKHAEWAAVLELWRLTGSDLPPETLGHRLPLGVPTTNQPEIRDDLPTLEQNALQRHPTWALLVQEAQRARQAVGDLQPMLTALHAVTAPDPTTGAAQTLPAFTSPPRWPHSWDKALQSHIEADMLERRIRADVRLAHSAWQNAQTLAREIATESQRLHTALEEDTLQRYNGMFKSTWDLLAATRTRLQAVHAAQQAQLSVALAGADLRAVLDGLPYTGTALRAGTAAPTPEKGH